MSITNPAGRAERARSGAEPVRIAPAIDAPSGSRRRLVLVMASATSVVVVLGQVGVIGPLTIGGVNATLAMVPALGLAVACGQRLLGRSADRRAAVAFWVAATVVLASLAVVYARTERLDLWVGLVVASSEEELIYRLALPAVIAVGLRALRLAPGTARALSLVIAGAWFVVLPGHLDQMDGVLDVVPFIAFATLTGLVVHRSGSVLPLAVSHAIANLLTVLMWSDEVAGSQRSMWLACILVLLVMAYGRPRRLTLGDDGGMVDTVTGQAVRLVDLRDGERPTAILDDGTRLQIMAGSAGFDTVPSVGEHPPDPVAAPPVPPEAPASRTAAQSVRKFSQ